MKRWVSVALLALLGACGTDEGTVTGEIAPVDAFASVLLFSGGEYVAEGRANRDTGEFRLDVPPGSYDVVVLAEGYRPYQSAAPIEVSSGQKQRLERIVLFKAGTGSVAGRLEPPVEGALVSALSGTAVVTTTSTDANGEFVLTGLPVGAYYVAVNAAGYARAQVDSVLVEDGVITTLDPIALEELTEPTGGIEGTVEPSGVVAAVTVFSEGVPVASTFTSSGAYSLDSIVAGTYSITIAAAGYGSAVLEGVVVNPGETTVVAGVALTKPTRTVTGLVLDLDTRLPVSGVKATLGGAVATTDANGEFVLADPPAGTATLILERSYYVPSFRSVAVPSTGDVELTFDLAPAGEVRGFVRSGGSGVPGAVVAAGSARSYASSSGEYALVHLRPGRYWVQASSPGHASAGVNVDVIAGQTVQTDLVLERAGSIAGTVVDAVSLTPLSGVRVSSEGAASMTDANGSFQLDGVPVGTRRVDATLDHYSSAGVNVTVVADGTTPVEIALTPHERVKVTGVVRDQDGTPVPSAQVYFGDGYEFSASTSASGTYSIGGTVGTGVPRDVTSVRIWKSGFPTVTQPIDLSDTGTTEFVIDLVVPSYASVTGRVVDASSGESVSGALTVCSGGSAYTDDYGTFAIGNVTPGQVSCYVSSNCYPYSPLTFELGPGASRFLEIALPRRSDLHVLVREAPSGNPIVSASVASGSFSALTGADGVAILECVFEGEHIVQASREGYINGAARVLVPSTGRVDASVDLIASE